MLRNCQARTERVVRDLDRLDLMHGLLSHEKLELAQNFLSMTFRQGDYILREGEAQNVWVILTRGECVISHSKGGRIEELGTLRGVQHFGERALLRDEPVEASIRVTSADAQCLVLDGPTFKELAGLLSHDPAFRCAMEDDFLDYARKKVSSCPKLVGFLPRLRELPHAASDEFIGRQAVKLDPAVNHRALDRVGLLGTGSFGTVTMERDPATGQLFALKTVSKGLIVKLGLQESVTNERKILTMIDSPFTLRLHGTFKDQQYIYFLFEPLLGGDLHTHIHRKRTEFLFRRPDVYTFVVACTVCALAHLHERNIVFRDLKPENVLLDANGYAKVCDYGFAKFVLGRTFTLCGTPEYVAPEVIALGGHDRMVDWWALGVLTYEVISGETPFVGSEEDAPPVVIFCRIKAGVQEAKFPFEEPAAVSFVRSLLQTLPGNRLGIGGASQVMRDPFFQRVDFGALQRQETKAPYVPQLASEDDLSMFVSDDQEMPSFVHYEGDASGWDAAF